jgi:hypothetical protein
MTMSRPVNDQSAAESSTRPAACPSPGDPAQSLTPEQIRRWAALIADGSSELPSDLPEQDEARLTAEVRLLLRTRLIATIAEIIAVDIERGQSSANRNASAADVSHSTEAE